MRPTDKIESLIKSAGINTNTRTDKKVLGELLYAFEEHRQNQAGASRVGIWRTIMRNRAGKFAAAAAIIVVIVSILLMERFNQPAWAIEQTIEAMKNYKGIYSSGTIVINGAETNYEMWACANGNDSMTEGLLVKLGGGSIIQVKDNKTYYYIRQENTVYVDDAKTAGFSTMFGPQFYKLVERAPEYKTSYGADASTGRKVAVITCSLTDVSGPASWMIELDVESKLPVAMKRWDNLNSMGSPSFNTKKMLFFDHLPDSSFDVEIPADAKYTDRPLSISEDTIALLNHPKYGMSAENKTQQQAAKEIVEKLYTAVIAGDIAAFKELCPLADAMSDEFIRYAVLYTGTNNQIIELVSTGDICKTGESKLGALAVLPVVYRTKDGKLWDEKIIVQFRQTGGNSSCVIYGPYGLSVEKK